MIVLTQGVVGKHFDDATICYLPVMPTFNHRFEICFQRYQTRYTSLDFLKPRLRNEVRIPARLIRSVSKQQQCSDCLNLESQFTRMPDKGKSTQVVTTESSAIALGSWWGWQQANPFVIANRRDFDSTDPRGFAYGCFGSHCALQRIRQRKSRR